MLFELQLSFVQVGDSWHRSRPHLSQVAASHHYSHEYLCPHPNYIYRHQHLQNSRERKIFILYLLCSDSQCWRTSFASLLDLWLLSRWAQVQNQNPYKTLDHQLMLDLSLLQPLRGFSGDDKGTRRHSSSLLLPHLLPQVDSTPQLCFWCTWNSISGTNPIYFCSW